MAEARRHVLIWVIPEFLKSSGMVQLFTEAEILTPPQEGMDEYSRLAELAGGFAMTGTLASDGHGAGIWISPAKTPGLELMVPWQYVRTVITAEAAQASKMFGLVTEDRDHAY